MPTNGHVRFCFFDAARFDLSVALHETVTPPVRCNLRRQTSPPHLLSPRIIPIYERERIENIARRLIVESTNASLTRWRLRIDREQFSRYSRMREIWKKVRKIEDGIFVVIFYMAGVNFCLAAFFLNSARGNMKLRIKIRALIYYTNSFK